ncbi:hypothetical protein AAC387_Pa04g2864 [Persea americana]
MSSLNVETLQNQQADQDNPSSKKPIQRALLVICMIFTAVGAIGGPLMQRLYYIHGGSRKWLSSCLQTLGFPIIVLPLLVLYAKSQSKKIPKSFFIERRLVMAGLALGLLLGLDNYMYSFGLVYIPVSTSSLLFSTQLAFTAVFAFVIVRQKFSFYCVNCVVLMTLGACVLALHTSGDRPTGVSGGQYLLGFFITLGGAMLLGLSLPLIELSYRKAFRVITYSVVMQYQVLVSFSASVFCLIGMAINKDFQAIPREAKAFDLGEVKYYAVLVCSAIIWQFLSIGSLGIIYCTSSLFAGIVSALLLPFTPVAAVLAFGEKFTGEKGMSLALCLWGFTSYFIGVYKNSTKLRPNTESVANGPDV